MIRCRTYSTLHIRLFSNSSKTMQWWQLCIIITIINIWIYFIAISGERNSARRSVCPSASNLTKSDVSPAPHFSSSMNLNFLYSEFRRAVWDSERRSACPSAWNETKIRSFSGSASSHHQWIWFIITVTITVTVIIFVIIIVIIYSTDAQHNVYVTWLRSA